MPYCSFVVFSPHPVAFVDPLVLLDQGRNVFSANIKDLAEFRQALEQEGCRVVQEHILSSSAAEQAEIAPSLLLAGVQCGDGSQLTTTAPRLPGIVDSAEDLSQVDDT